jgi:GMP synthase (glutamine-hydrolysing)
MFDPKKFVDEQVRLIKKAIDGNAVIAASGGVDSTVAAILVSSAIGKKLTAVFVDTGYMRKNEPEETKKMLESLGLNLNFVDARKEYYEALAGIVDPEEKRKIIGNKFIEIFERIAKKVKAEYLIQGTIAPDWIESGGTLRDKIKSHHNVVGLPLHMKLKLVEPLKDLYKDEVRKVAEYLKVSVAKKQPFPGPGLAIRVMGEATPELTDIAREANAIAEEEIEKAVNAGKMEKPWQYFAVLLPTKTVGVHGDVRAYGYTIAVRAVHSIDGMSAGYAKIPHEILERISTRLTNVLGKKINRVVYDITNKPPGTIEWE